MMLFNFKTSKKHIKKFEHKLAELLPDEFFVFKKIANEPNLNYSISFTQEPKGIIVQHGYTQEFFNKYVAPNRKNFNLKGVYIRNKKSGDYEQLTLDFYQNSLNRIVIDKPEEFHKLYDINSLKIRELEAEYYNIDNPDIEIVNRILIKLSQRQKEFLEIDDTFEIKYDNNLYYPILNMEDGNYIAVDQKGIVYRLNHDHDNQIKKIADRPGDFFKIYNGDKNILNRIMDEK